MMDFLHKISRHSLQVKQYQAIYHCGYASDNHKNEFQVENARR